MFFFYYCLITLSMIGYGILISKFINYKFSDYGTLGILGLIFFSIISYFSSFFISHGYLFNLLSLMIGIFSLVFYWLKNAISRIEIFKLISVFIVLFIFVLVGKNHDDFPYYHFPYTILLTEFAHPIGIGQLNNGFRSPSSLFFISSMFYYPNITYYLTHIVSVFILGFSNIYLLKIIFDKQLYKKNFFINLLSLILFSFTNIFFYRLAEHGTDRSGMILIFLSIIILLQIINIKNDNSNSIKDNIKLLIIYICFTVTIKPFYLIYTPLLMIPLYYKNTQKLVFELIFSRTALIGFILIFFTIFYTFINSSCLIFPLSFTCFQNLSWSLDKQLVEEVKIWFELWSKSGATPNFVIDDKLNYINKFNWLSNWIDNYFYNKVFDFILGIIFLSIIFILFFHKRKKLAYTKKKYLLVYFFLLIFLIEWFLKHPTLRYGGYHIIALSIFIPLSLFLQRSHVNMKSYIYKASIIILITICIFITRNTIRIHKEYRVYDYNPLKNTNFKFIGGNKQFYFRYNNLINENFDKYQNINFLGFSKKVIILNNKEKK